MTRRAWLPAALLLAGCNAQPQQWLVSVATDAPVPQFGDRVLLEVIGANASCTGCLRVIGVDGPGSLPVSFGVVPLSGGGPVRVRARLYRTAQTGPDGLPTGSALIDAVGELPPLDGEARVALDLSMRCFGVSSDPDHGKTCDPATGALGAVPVLPFVSAGATQPVAGSWPNAAQVPCKGQVPDDMKCVPGGAFIMGTPQPTYVVDDCDQTQPEHLVQLDPFALDVDEVTVGTVLELVKQGKLTSTPVSKAADSTSLVGACTYAAGAGAAEQALPVNCVSRTLAVEICAALGKRLPSEAEWEYAAGNLDQETSYPWGDDVSNLCQQAWISVGRQNAEGDMTADLVENPGCRPNGTPAWGPVAGGDPNDVTALGIKNMAGSMREWTADDFELYTGPCWQPQGTLLSNVVCSGPPAVCNGTPASYSVRGGWWAGPSLSASATARDWMPSELGDPYTGIRCAMSP